MSKVQRWYAGFSYKGKAKAKQLMELISSQVNDHSLSGLVPLLRIEKGAKNKKMFYFFLGIESDIPGQLPEEVESKLMPLEIFKYQIPGKNSFSYEEIRPMVDVAYEVCDYTYPIPYQVKEEAFSENPLDLAPVSENDFRQANSASFSESSERFLYWLSALGSGTWESFKKACNTLNLPEPKRILRRLKLLGYLETSANGKRWSIAPTALVQIPAKGEVQEFLLLGQRNIKLVEELKKYPDIETIHKPRGNAPNCIRIKTENSSLITSQLSIINAGVASLKLAEALPELSAWQQSLTDLQGIVPSLYDWKIWEVNKNDFIQCYFEAKTGMYEMKHREKNGKSRPPMTLFYDGETQTWKQGDWYGLRYLAWYYSPEPCRAWYDSANRRFAVPYSQRWPELYERALVLASGLLPYFQTIEANKWLIYENIDRQLMQKLTEKLHVIYQEA